MSCVSRQELRARNNQFWSTTRSEAGMGSFKLTDVVGLDVRLAIAETLHATLGKPHYEPPKILRDKVKKGELGRKAGKGFYTWSG
jgi:3-hydroxyacyl-CoA dehydrogenase